MVIGANPTAVSATLVFLGMYTIAIGTGGIKPNVSTLGADQFDDRYSKDRKEKESFFNWFYWAINLGALISYTLVAYICQYGFASIGGVKWGFFDGYLIPTVMMAIAVAVFIMGTPRYKIPKPAGSVLSTTIKILNQAVYKYLGSVYNNARGGSYSAVDQNASDTTNSKKMTSSVSGVSTGVATEGPMLHVLDRAKQRYGGGYTDIQVECVKLVTRIMPFLLTMIPYWGVYSQMSTAFQNQGCQMNLFIGSAGIPVSLLNIFDTIAILALLPVFDGFVYPYFAKIGRPLSMLTKIGAGFIFAMVAMLVAAIVESERIRLSPAAGNYYDTNARNNISPCQNIDNFDPNMYQQWVAGIDDATQPLYCSQTCDNYYSDNGQLLLNLTCIDCDDIPQMSNISVFWQIPQFALIGISEILASITSLEFFYSQSPSAMRSVIQSFNLCTSAVGSFIIIPLIYLVNVNPNNEWITNNLNDGHLTYYFLVLAALMVANQVVFWWLSLGYVYKTNAELQVDEADFQGTVSGAAGASHLGSYDIDVDPHTGHEIHRDPTSGAWVHSKSRSGSRSGSRTSSVDRKLKGNASDVTGDMMMTKALLDGEDDDDESVISFGSRSHWVSTDRS